MDLDLAQSFSKNKKVAIKQCSEIMLGRGLLL